jgi:hypothetical protein
MAGGYPIEKSRRASGGHPTTSGGNHVLEGVFLGVSGTNRNQNLNEFPIFSLLRYSRVAAVPSFAIANPNPGSRFDSALRFGKIADVPVDFVLPKFSSNKLWGHLWGYDDRFRAVLQQPVDTAGVKTVPMHGALLRDAYPAADLT